VVQVALAVVVLAELWLVLLVLLAQQTLVVVVVVVQEILSLELTAVLAVLA
jgi:hypothetical protein